MMKTLTIDRISPYARMSRYMLLNEASYYLIVKAYDHRLFYALEGEGTIIVDNMAYCMKKGDLLLYQSGISYELLKSNVGLKIIAINFDFTFENSFQIAPIPPDPFNKFRDKNIIERIEFSDISAFNSVLYAENMQKLVPYLIELIDEYDTKRLYYIKKSSALLQLIFTLIARSISSKNSYKTDQVIDAIIAYIQQNYNKSINNISIGEELNFHPNYLNKLIVENTGVSLHQYLLNYRLTKALDLLQTTSLTIDEIAQTVGFSDINHFSKYFKQKNGAPPSKFR